MVIEWVFLQFMFSEILRQFCLPNNRIFYNAHQDDILKKDIYYQGFLIDVSEFVSVYNSMGPKYYIYLLLIDGS